MTTHMVRKVMIATAAAVLAVVGFLVPAPSASAQSAVFGDALYDVPFGPADLGSVAVEYPAVQWGVLPTTRFKASVRTRVPTWGWDEGDGIYWFLTKEGSADPSYVIALFKFAGTAQVMMIDTATDQPVCNPGMAEYGDTFEVALVGCDILGTFSFAVMTSFLTDPNDPATEVNDFVPEWGSLGPIYRGSTRPTGHLDLVTSPDGSGVVRAVGWALDPDGDQQVEVILKLDGTQVWRGWANLSRPDVGLHGFDAYVTAASGDHQVCAEGINREVGPNGPLGCTTVHVADQVPVGAFEQAYWAAPEVVRLVGWAFDPDLGTAASRVRIQQDISPTVIEPPHIPYRYLVADVPRPDVGAAHPAAGPNHGFTLDVPLADPGPGYLPMSLFCVRALQGVEVGTLANGTELGCQYPALPAPPAPTAVAGLESATLTWTAPWAPSYAPITGYRITVSPGGAVREVDATSTSTTLEGLTGGLGYSFTVQALNKEATGLASPPSNTVTPTSRPGAGFHPVVPFRALDSRTSIGGWNAPLGPGATADLVVAGANGIPPTASAVVMNVTITGGTAGSYLTAYPAGAARPLAANLNFSPQQTVPNLVTAKVGAGGAVTFFNAQGNVHVVADVVGYYDDGVTGIGDRFGGETPTRLLDSRTATGGWASTPLGSGQTRDVTVAGAAGVPPSATGVVMNVTVTGGTAASYLQAFPAGATQPVTANLLFAPNQTVSNLVTVKLGTGGKVSLFNQQGSVHVVADVVGWFGPSGDLFHAVSPTRVLDSRSATGGWASTALGPGQSRPVPVGGVLGIPMTASAAVANLVAVQPSTGTYLTDFPAGQAVPVAASLLVAPGEIRPNLTTVALGTGTQLAVFNQLGTVHVVIDVAGYYAPT